jgi:transcriptional regulator with XRE-family HTH domain
MPPKTVQRKFLEYGRKAEFARLAGVSRVTVTLWLRGERPLPRLDKLAREWQPTAPVA